MHRTREKALRLVGLVWIGATMAACSDESPVESEPEDHIVICPNRVEKVIHQYWESITSRDLVAYRSLHGPGAVVSLDTDLCLPWLDSRWWLSQVGACWDGEISAVGTILNQEPIFDSDQQAIGVEVTEDVEILLDENEAPSCLRLIFQVVLEEDSFRIGGVSLWTESSSGGVPHLLQ